MSKPAKIAGLILLSVLAVGYGLHSMLSSKPDITGGDREAGFALKWLEKVLAGNADYCLENAAGPLASRDRVDQVLRDCQSLGGIQTRAVKTKGPRQTPDGQVTVVVFAARYAKAPSVEESVEVVADKAGKLKVRSVSFAPPQLPTQLPAAKPLTDADTLDKVRQASESWLYLFDQGDQRALTPLAFGSKKVINIGKVRHLAQIRERRGKASSRKMSAAVLQSGIPGATSLELARTAYNSQYAQGNAWEFVWLKRDSSADSPRWEVYDYSTKDAVSRKPR